jgi:hypothetical protein
MKLKRGSMFTHKHLLDSDYAPLRCVVLQVENGIVYWAQDVTVKQTITCSWFAIENADIYVKQISLN